MCQGQNWTQNYSGEKVNSSATHSRNPIEGVIPSVSQTQFDPGGKTYTSHAPAVTGDGTFELPTSEEDIRAFLSTLERCYNDLYW